MAFDFFFFLMFLFSEVKLKTTTGNRKKMKMNDRIRVVNRQESGEEVSRVRRFLTAGKKSRLIPRFRDASPK